MNEKREELSELQSNVVHMRINHKNAIINREKQNVDIELDILERTEIISIYKMADVDVPTVKPIDMKLFKPSEVESEIDIDILSKQAKEMKHLVDMHKHRICPVTKLLKFGD